MWTPRRRERGERSGLIGFTVDSGSWLIVAQPGHTPESIRRISVTRCLWPTPKTPPTATVPTLNTTSHRERTVFLRSHREDEGLDSPSHKIPNEKVDRPVAVCFRYGIVGM